MGKRGAPKSSPPSAKVAKSSLKPWAKKMNLSAESFDPMIDQHPVQWLLDNLKPELYTPMNEWFAEVLGRQPLHPSDVMMPDLTAAALCLEIPVLAFVPKTPSDGLPILADWMGNALSIWSIGYEPHREGLEVKPLFPSQGGHAMGFGCLEAAKGTGRISILLFTVTYTYLKLKNSLSAEELEEFKGWLGTSIVIQGTYLPQAADQDYVWRRIQVSQVQAEKQRKSVLQLAMVFHARTAKLMQEDGTLDYKTAFLASIDEFNSYGLALHDSRLRIEPAQGSMMYGFKVGVAPEVWNLIQKHLHVNKFENSAFSHNTLLNGRWLLEGLPSGADGMWHDVLKMTATKQHIFMQRILFMFEVTKRKAGKAQVLRVGQDVWDHEADVCCFAGDVLEHMRTARDENNMLIFEPKLLATLLSNFIEGDYHAEFKPIVEIRDPLYKPEHTNIWVENLPSAKTSSGQDQLAQADSKIESLQQSQNKLQFDADALSLARDASMIASLYKQHMKSERANRLARVMHIKQQNAIGSAIVCQYMQKHCKHVAGPVTSLTSELDKAIDMALHDGASMVVWLDFMKCGVVSKDELNHTIGLVHKALTRLPNQAVAFIVAPSCTSDRRGGIREELRRVEDKLDAKGLDSECIQLRCQTAPSTKRVQLTFPAWVVFNGGVQSGNKFWDCQLLQDKCLRELLSWTPESQYIVPSGDTLHASEGMRALSTPQEQAQLLCGRDLPTGVLNGLLTGSDVGRLVKVVNLTPYDGRLERVCLRWSIANPDREIHCLSLSSNLGTLNYCEKDCALYLLEDWKSDCEVLGRGVRQWDPNPPPEEQLDLNNIHLKMANITKDSSKKGWEAYQVSLSNEVRGLHLQDPVNAPAWRSLITDFDKKFCGNMVINETAVVSAEEEQDPASMEPEPWVKEPKDLTAMTDEYIIETKIPGRVPGTSLYVVQSRKRNGDVTECLEGQSMKLFLVAHQEVDLSEKEYQICHGKSTFLKPEKVAKMQREHTGVGDPMAYTLPCRWTSDQCKVVLEIPSESSKATTDAEPCTIRQLMVEFEESSIVDATLHQHSCERPGADVTTDHDYYMVKPEKTVPIFSYTPGLGNVKFSTAASAFSAQVLEASRTLACYWRVMYVKAEKEIRPRKPLYFLRQPLSLAANEVVRLL